MDEDCSCGKLPKTRGKERKPSRTMCQKRVGSEDLSEGKVVVEDECVGLGLHSRYK